MLEKNKNYCGDTIETMKKIDDKSIQLILTSPPYRRGQRIDGLNNIYQKANKDFDDNMTDEEYVNWSVEIFKQYDRILKDTGVVAYNLSYTTYSPSLPYFVIQEVFKNTNFIIADTVSWEKSSCIPSASHPQALTRKCELVYIFVKKQHIKDYDANKEVNSVVEKTGQKFFKIYYNLLKAKNNDGKMEGHGATFSSDFAKFFIDLYSFPDSLVLDNFMGTGTVAVACCELGRKWIGIDNAQAYIDMANERISQVEFVGHRWIKDEEPKKKTVKKPRKPKEPKTEELIVDISTGEIIEDPELAVGENVVVLPSGNVVKLKEPTQDELDEFLGTTPTEADVLSAIYEKAPDIIQHNIDVKKFHNTDVVAELEKVFESEMEKSHGIDAIAELDRALTNSDDIQMMDGSIESMKELNEAVKSKKPIVEESGDDWFDKMAGL